MSEEMREVGRYIEGKSTNLWATTQRDDDTQREYCRSDDYYYSY